MKTDEIIKSIKESGLRTSDYFDSNIFYYMAGRFPHMSIGRCAKIIDQIRDEIFDTEKGESL